MMPLTRGTRGFVDVLPEWALIDRPLGGSQENSSFPIVLEAATEESPHGTSANSQTILGAALQAGLISQSEFQPAPLNPSWILSGNPKARSLPLGASPDGNLTFGLWDCTEGQFLFKYRSDEIVHILEGEATVIGAGMKIHLRPGVVAFFPKGSTLHWTVRSPIKKLWIFRSVEQSVFGRISGKLKRICQKLRQPFLRNKNEKNAHSDVSRSSLTQPVLGRPE